MRVTEGFKNQQKILDYMARVFGYNHSRSKEHPNTMGWFVQKD